MRRKQDPATTGYRCHEAYRRTRSWLVEICRASDRRARGDEVLSRLRHKAARAAVCLTGPGAPSSHHCLETSLVVLDEAGTELAGAAAQGRIGIADASALARAHREARSAVSAALSCLLSTSVEPSSHLARGVEVRD